MTNQSICLRTDGIHLHHMSAVSSACRMTPEDDAKLEAPMTPDTHSVKATSDAYWTKGCGADILARDRQESMDRMHAEALQDDLIRDLSNVSTPAGYLAFLAATAKVNRTHTEALREQAFRAIIWMNRAAYGRRWWCTNVHNAANRGGRGDVWQAIRDVVELDHEDALDEDRKRAALGRLIARMV